MGEMINPNIPQHILKVCKIGQGTQCCRYLNMGPEGWGCAKVKPEEKMIFDRSWANDDHVSQGDNCEGQPDLNNMPK